MEDWLAGLPAHLVEDAKAQLADGCLLALRQRRLEGNDFFLEDTQGHRDDHSISCRAEAQMSNINILRLLAIFSLWVA